MARRKRLYVPITRSGSSIIASFLTQLFMYSPSGPTHKPQTQKPEDSEFSTIIKACLYFALFIFIMRLFYLSSTH